MRERKDLVTVRKRGYSGNKVGIDWCRPLRGKLWYPSQGEIMSRGYGEIEEMVQKTFLRQNLQNLASHCVSLYTCVCYVEVGRRNESKAGSEAVLTSFLICLFFLRNLSRL